MNQQDISAVEAAINKSIEILEEAEGQDDVLSAATLASAWSDVALAISAHNSNVVILSLAEAAREWVSNPGPENWVELSAAVQQYVELG